MFTRWFRREAGSTASSSGSAGASSDDAKKKAEGSSSSPQRGSHGTAPGKLPHRLNEATQRALAAMPGITSIAIPQYRVKNTYVEYVIECREGHSIWRVYRRYQQFKMLDQGLRQLGARGTPNHGDYGVLPVLPGSHWMEVTNQSPELVDRRRRFLEIYLQQLLVPKNLFYAARTALYSFLHDGEIPLDSISAAVQPLLGFEPNGKNATDNNNSVSRVGDSAVVGQTEQGEDGEGQAVDTTGSTAAHTGPHSLPTPTPPPPAASHGGKGGEEEEEERQEETRDKLAESADYGNGPPSRPSRSRSSPSSPVSQLSASEEASSAPSPVPHTEAAQPLENTRGKDGGQQESAAPSGSPDCGVDSNPRSAVGGAKTGAVTTASSSPSQSKGTASQPALLHPLYARAAPANTTTSSSLAPSQPPSSATAASEAAVSAGLTSPSVTTVTSSVATTQGASNASALSATIGSITRWVVDEDVPSDTDSIFAESGDERLPPPAPNCLNCNTEFTSTMFPHRCFFCRNRFCCHCLWQLTMGIGPKGGSKPSNNANHKAVHACLQCTENYKRRVSRLLAPPTSPTTAEPPSGLPTVDLFTPSLKPLGTAQGSSMESIVQYMGKASVLGGPMLGAAPAPSVSVGLSDFQLLTVLGKGTFGKVMKVCYRGNGAVYAMKVLNKSVVYKRCMTSYINEEKMILMSLPPHPFVVHCHYAFQSNYYLFFVMDYLPGGEMYDLIYPRLLLSPEAARLYIAELVLAIEHIHRYDVVHRDLKPENIVLGKDGHACLTDFGLARRNFSRSRRRSFVGSAEYLAPETIRGEYQTPALDWWGLGVMLYEFLAGRAPFHADNNNAVYDNVVKKPLDFSAPCFSPEAISLLRGLLHRDVATRLQDPAAIKAHPYFAGLDWEALQRKEIPAPYVPADLADNDTRHFKREFTAEWAAVPKQTGISRESIVALNQCFNCFPLVADREEPSAQEGAGTDGAAPSASASPVSSPSSPATSVPVSAQKHAVPASTTAAAAAAVAGVTVTSITTPVALGTPSALIPAKQSAGGSPAGSPLARSITQITTGSPLGSSSFALPPPSGRLTVGDLLGLWVAVRVETRSMDGRLIYPWGGEVVGQLAYYASGLYNMQLSPAHRPRHVRRITHATMDRATAPELCDLISSYMASFGTFEVVAGQSAVRHVATGALMTTIVGRPMTLTYEVEDAMVHHSLDATNSPTGGCASSSSPPPFPCSMRLVTPAQKVPGHKFLAQTVITWRRASSNNLTAPSGTTG